MNISAIRKHCKERGITLAELERNAGIGNGVIARWQKLNSYPNVKVLKKVADYFGCTIDELVIPDK